MSPRRSYFLRRIVEVSPLSVMWLVFFLSYLPPIFFPLQGFSGLMVFIPLFYFTLNFPDKIGYLAVTLLGLTADALEGRIIGVNLFSLLFFQTAGAYQRIYILDKSFIITWLAFSLTLLAALSIKWALFALRADAIIPTAAFLISSVKLMALYPVFYFVFGKLYAERGHMRV